MDFNLSEEYQAFSDSVARFAQDKLAPGALDRAHSSQYPWETAQLLAEQGLLGIVFPEEDGGQGGSLMHAVLAIQQVALACPKSADIVQADRKSGVSGKSVAVRVSLGGRRNIKKK